MKTSLLTITLLLSLNSYAGNQLSKEDAKNLVSSKDSCVSTIKNECDADGLEYPGTCIVSFTLTGKDSSETHYVAFKGNTKMNQAFGKVGLLGGEFGWTNFVIGGTVAVIYQPFKYASYLLAKAAATEYTKDLQESANSCK
jgi:hypothetical protein